MTRNVGVTWARSLMVVGLLAASTAGCSVGFDLGRNQCEADDECAALGLVNGRCEDNVCVGSSLAPQWSCLDGFQAPVPSGDMVDQKFRFEYATAANVRPDGIAMHMCASLDQMCENPITVPQPDENGSVTISVGKDFTGYLEVTADGVVPTLVYLQEPIILPMEPNIIKLIRETEIVALAQAEGLAIDPMRGQVVVLTHNCNDIREAGVIINTVNQLPDDTLRFYFAGALPDPDGLQTDDQGAAGYFNMPPQGLTVESFIADSNRRIGKTGLTVRPGGITYAVVGPTED